MNDNFKEIDQIRFGLFSEDEIKKMIADAIAETGATGPAGMGLVMKVLSPKIAGKADGGVVSGLVKSALGQ